MQPVGLVGEVKLLDPVTLENIAEAIVRDGLADRARCGRHRARVLRRCRRSRHVVRGAAHRAGVGRARVVNGMWRPWVRVRVGGIGP